MHGQACILGGIEKDIHEGLHGQACIPRGIEKDIHEGLHGFSMTFTRGGMGLQAFQQGFSEH